MVARRPVFADLDPMAVLRMHTRAAAHELKNVFGHLTLYLDILEEEYGAGQEVISELRESLDLGVAAARNLMHLAAGAGREAVPTNARLVLGELQRLAQETLPPSVALTTSYPEELWTVHCDVVRLYSGLGRLLEAATAALPRGGTIAVKAENRNGSGEPVVVLSVAAFDETGSNEQTEVFLSHPLAGAAADPGLEATDNPDRIRTADVAGAIASWRFQLPVAGREP